MNRLRAGEESEHPSNLFPAEIGDLSALYPYPAFEKKQVQQRGSFDLHK